MQTKIRMGVLGLAASALLTGCATTEASSDALVLDGARLFDGKRVVEDARLVIEAGRIVAAGPASEIAVPAGAERRDLAGRTIIPGLIAAHSHVGMVEGVDQGGHNYTRETVARDLEQFQQYGIVAVNALGMNRPLFHELRREWRGRAPGADLYGAGAGVGAVDGAPPASMRPQPDQVDRPHNGDAARAAVDRMADAGVDMIKIWVDDLSGKAPKMAPDIYAAAVEQAHSRGLKTAAHIHALEDAKGVLAAGIDIIGHGVRDRAVDRDFIDAMLRADAWYIPTININEAEYIYADHPEWLDDPFFRAALNPALEAQFRDAEWRRGALARAAGARRQVEVNLANLRTLHAAGVKIALGTDSGATPLRIPGFAEHLELGHLVAAGMTPVEALTAATWHGAQVLGAADRGCLWSGCRADLLILSGDPTRDIAASRSIEQVWRNGRAVGRGS